MSIPSPAERAAPAPEGLSYPFGDADPARGAIVEIADGIGWARLSMLGPLKHVNVWLLDDGDGVAIVDTGLNTSRVRDEWEALIDGPLAGRRVTRVIVTHFHPDHLGLAGWLCERFAAPLWMTRTEWLLGRMLAADARDTPPPEAFDYWHGAGWEEARIAAAEARGWRLFASAVSAIPAQFIRLMDGDSIAIGDRNWRVVVGSGHSPEHACLIDDAGGIMIAGDQVLPRITSNVSLSLSEPSADPLGEWLASIDKLRSLSPDLLVLPSHGDPFTGLHPRLDALDTNHRDRLTALEAFLDTPRRAVDCFPILFDRPIDDTLYGLATGEALAHLRHLEVTGRAVREQRGRTWWFARAA
ncbi:MBL fold metallo-hydrolase [Allosphingosinicella indica]|uniref:Glyoxylase, beta-lactamase superfamily II n=1 Tax=Allosphingosinicella indica TaxID=941907 RepID=A0A1X7GFZ8_9SPHN|nr:MBL fold metallo-hydrolase [Allosphingosinicella indica]SMF69122.1 Glyoxylase, beta-lactamase superfamily II [Allosphingosinicella indica]